MLKNANDKLTQSAAKLLNTNHELSEILSDEIRTGKLYLEKELQERKEREEKERLEKLEKERLEKLEKERLEKLEKERLEKERKEKENAYMNQLQAVFNKEPAEFYYSDQERKWRQLDPINIREFATKFGLKIDTSKAIDADG